MSKIIETLKDVERERRGDAPGPVEPDFLSPPSAPTENSKDTYPGRTAKKGAVMNNQWLIWALVILLIGGVLFVFNYQGAQEAVPLSEIFPEPDVREEAPVEYVFVDSPAAEAPEPAKAASPQTAEPVKSAPATIIPPVAPPVEKSVVTPDPAALSQGAYTIQVGSFRKKDRAEAMLKELTQAGHPAQIVSKDLQEKGLWYRLYVGAFATKSEADQYIPKLKSGYSDSFVRRL